MDARSRLVCAFRFVAHSLRTRFELLPRTRLRISIVRFSDKFSELLNSLGRSFCGQTLLRAHHHRFLHSGVLNALERVDALVRTRRRSFTRSTRVWDALLRCALAA